VTRGPLALALLLLTTHAAFDRAALAQQSPPARPAIEFADGVPVTFTSKDPSTEIYLAHGDVPVGTTPDPFERIGLAPVTLKLAAGTYTLESASPTSSTGHQRFAVEQGRPLSVDVRPGNAGLKTVGGVFIGLGIVSMILGVVAIVSFSPGDANYNRFGVGLPLLFGGGALAGVGVTMAAVGATDVRVRSQDRPSAPRATSLVPSLVWRF
jgi:hypothetical protein